MLKNEGKEFRLIMLGFGADENAIKKKIRKCGLFDYVIWTGKILDRNELLGYYGISDLLLFPSTFDTNGLVVREAAACATPSLWCVAVVRQKVWKTEKQAFYVLKAHIP